MRKIYVPNIYVKITVLISNGSLASIINASMLKTVLSKSEEIIAKELSLAGVQRPLPSGYIKYNLVQAVEIFRFGEFAGWVYERAE